MGNVDRAHAQPPSSLAMMHLTTLVVSAPVGLTLAMASALAACSDPGTPSPAQDAGSAGSAADGIGGSSGEGDDARDPATEEPGSDATGGGGGPEAPPPSAGCEVSAELGEDPLVITHTVTVPENVKPTVRTHITAVERDPVRDVIYALGLGGVMAFDAAHGGISYLGTWREGDFRRIYAGAVLDQDHLVVANRDVGVAFLDTGDPTHIVDIATFDVPDVSSLAVAGTQVYAGGHDGKMHVFDIADPGAPSFVDDSIPGDNIWAMAAADGMLYAADDGLGVIVLDASGPGDPSPQLAVDTLGAPQDLVVGAGHLYVAEGSAGVQIFKIGAGGTALLEPVGALALPGPALGLSWSDGRLWVNDQDGVAVFDAADPAAPTLLAHETTSEWSLSGQAEGTTAWMGNWSMLHRMELDSHIEAPELHVDKPALYLGPGESDTLTVSNIGPATLEISGSGTTPEGLELEGLVSSLAPGAQATLTLTWTGTGEDHLDGAFCLSTNDPDEALVELPVVAPEESGASAYGGQAPDFTLQDLDGAIYTLSDNIGRPVLLVFFATWCPICKFEMMDIDTALYEVYSEQGLEVWGIAAEDPEPDVLKYVAQLGIGFPVLMDPTGKAASKYQQLLAFEETIYPQEWLIDAAGEVIWFSSTYDPEVLIPLIVEELANPAGSSEGGHEDREPEPEH